MASSTRALSLLLVLVATAGLATAQTVSQSNNATTNQSNTATVGSTPAVITTPSTPGPASGAPAINQTNTAATNQSNTAVLPCFRDSCQGSNTTTAPAAAPTVTPPTAQPTTPTTPKPAPLPTNTQPNSTTNVQVVVEQVTQVTVINEVVNQITQVIVNNVQNIQQINAAPTNSYVIDYTTVNLYSSQIVTVDTITIEIVQEAVNYLLTLNIYGGGVNINQFYYSLEIWAIWVRVTLGSQICTVGG